MTKPEKIRIRANVVRRIAPIEYFFSIFNANNIKSIAGPNKRAPVPPRSRSAKKLPLCPKIRKYNETRKGMIERQRTIRAYFLERLYLDIFLFFSFSIKLFIIK